MSLITSGILEPMAPVIFQVMKPPTHTYVDPGIYEVMLVVSAPFTCSDTSYQNFQVFGLLEPNYPEQPTQCLDGNQFDFTALGASTNNATYLWDFGPEAIPATSNQANPQNIVFTEPQMHTVSLTIAENGCTETYIDSVLVTTYLAPAISINNSDGCEPLSVEIVADVESDVQVYYMWNFGDGNSSFVGETSHIYAFPGTYDISVELFTMEGCADTVVQVFPNAVTVHPSPVAGLTMNPQVVNILNPEMMIADSSFGSVSCSYVMSDGGSSDECDFTYSWIESGFQTITQYVESEFGCNAYVTGTVIVEGFVFYAPNSFTPDNDGLNDFWLPEMTGISSYSLKIFNRWGDLIHASEDLEKPWFGEVHDGDHVAQNGVYNYVVLVEDLTGLPHEFVGHISLIR
jgi:gliding motility-associated-like protein